MSILYPLKFKPIFKERIWGGQMIKSIMGLDSGELTNCGEAWLLSGVENDPSIVSNGFLAGNELNELLEVYMYDLVGDAVYDKYGNTFPVLIKLIDANDWLSIQVHPDDALAAQRKIGNGKTEMWYVLAADKHSQLISGFSRKINKEEYLHHLQDNSLPQILNYEDVTPGDVFFMPAGRVHALGPGILLAEIQQTSDVTYRIYDWDRTDAKGNRRELHIDEALDAIDFENHDRYKTEFTKPKNKTVTLASCEHFTTSLIALQDQAIEKDYSSLDSFAALLCTGGKALMSCEGEQYQIEKGEIVLIPAIINSIHIRPLQKTEFLEVHM